MRRGEPWYERGARHIFSFGRRGRRCSSPLTDNCQYWSSIRNVTALPSTRIYITILQINPTVLNRLSGSCGHTHRVKLYLPRNPPQIISLGQLFSNHAKYSKITNYITENISFSISSPLRRDYHTYSFYMNSSGLISGFLKGNACSADQLCFIDPQNYLFILWFFLKSGFWTRYICLNPFLQSVSS